VRLGAWLRGDEEVRRAIREGKEVDVTLSNYGQNDFLLEFLMGSGLWELLVSLRPEKLRKENGKPWRALNGLEVLRELLGVERISHCGRVIADTRLMMIAGFNAEEIRRRQRHGGLVVTPETLSNHLGRMSPRGAVDAFFRHVKLLKQRGWLGRKGVYAADGHMITFPHARGWEGMGKVGDAHGYKLLVVQRIEPLPVRIVGFALGPLEASEHQLLRMVLRGLEQKVAPVREFMETLVLDRGYWGAKFLLGLRERHRIHFVTRPQHDELAVVKYVNDLVKAEGGLEGCLQRRERRLRQGEITVTLKGFDGVPLFDEYSRELGRINAVVAQEQELTGKPVREKDGTPRGPTHYITSLPARKAPELVRDHYQWRWRIENEGFRNLTQRWSLDVAPARSLTALVARLFFVLTLANAESIVSELFPGDWRRERKNLGKLGVQGFMGGMPEVAAYTKDGHLGLMTVREYGELVEQRTRKTLLEQLHQEAARGKTIEDLLRELGGSATS
jgi:hypothetical protein